MKELDLENTAKLKHEEDILVSVRNLSKKYSLNLRSSLKNGVKDIFHELSFWRKADLQTKLQKDEFWALENISFELRRGESLAIIGGNGAGKSTLLKLLYGLIKPDVGEIHICGTLEAIIEINSGLNYVLSGRENIYVKAALLGLKQAQTDSLVEQIINFAEIEEFIDSPIQFYSTGMVSRLSFAISTQLNPDILIIDEVLAVGDYNFQRKCIDYLSRFVSKGGSVILVSHDSIQLQTICQKAIILKKGRVEFIGNTIDAIDKYLTQQNPIPNHIPSIPESKLVSEQNQLIIEKVLMESLQGNDIKTGDDVRLTISYRSQKEIKDTFWVFNIYTKDNSICVAGNTTPIPATFNQGLGKISCEIPNFNLVAGTYLLKIAISFDFDSSVLPLAILGWQDAPHIFTVHSSPSKMNNSQKTHRQLIVMEAK